MGKKRSREADVKTADPVVDDVDKMDEDSGEVCNGSYARTVISSNTRIHIGL